MRVWGTDLDGCIALIENELAKRIEEEFGIPQSRANMLKFYMHERYDVPEDAMNAFLGSDKCFADPKFWMDAEPHIENINEMQKWVMRGTVPSIITGRWATARLATEAWCAKYNVPYSNALFGTKNRKHKAIQWTDCSFFIEDRWEEALTIAKKTEATSYIFQTPYNEEHLPEYDRLVASGAVDGNKLVWIKSYKEVTEREF